MSTPRLSLVVGGEPVLGGAGQPEPGAAAPDGSLHLHIHLDREAHLDREGREGLARDAGEGRPATGYAHPVLVSLGAVALAVVSFYAGQHGRPAVSGGAVPAAAMAAAPATRLPFGSATPVLPGNAADALPPALRAQLAAPPTVIPPPAAPTIVTPPPGTPTAPSGPPRAKNPFGLGE